MNGDVTNLEGIVATQSDYEKYADTHRIMLMFLNVSLYQAHFFSSVIVLQIIWYWIA